jgi:hypothetical protein
MTTMAMTTQPHRFNESPGLFAKQMRKENELTSQIVSLNIVAGVSPK